MPDSLPDEQRIRDLAHLLLDLADEIDEERELRQRRSSKARHSLDRRILRIYCEEDGERGQKIIESLGLDRGDA